MKGEEEPGVPSADFVDAVMRQVATRPLPRRSWWRRLTAAREVTVRVHPARWALSAAALAALVVLVARPRPMTSGPVTAAVSHPVREGETVLIRFALAAPKAQAVSLAGDFNGWRTEATPLVRGADGVWSVQVPLQRGNWSYSFVVDGQWVEDPLAESWRADGFGGRNAVVRVGDVTPLPARGG